MNGKEYSKPKDRERKKIIPKDANLEFSLGSGWEDRGVKRKRLEDTLTGLKSTGELREVIDDAFDRNDVNSLRRISRHFKKVSGIYGSVVRYLAQTPTYDHLIYPKASSMSSNITNLENETYNRLELIESMRIKDSLATISSNVIVDGVSYVYMRHRGGTVVFQELPVGWSRVGGMSDGFPAIQFNLDYFDKTFPEIHERLAQVNKYPREIVSGYYELLESRVGGNVVENQRIKQAGLGYGRDTGNWLQLEPKSATAFFFENTLEPILSNSFYSILDFLEIKAVEKTKNENELYNLVVQQFPLDNDGEPVIDFVEMQQFHSSGKKIFEGSDMTDLLTTFADVKNINLNEASGEQYNYNPWRVDVYGDLGVSPQLFSTEGNLALERSINVDEALMFKLTNKFQDWINYYMYHELDKNKDSESEKKTEFSLWIPPVTIGNRKDMIKLYKDMASYGYSKLLPAIATGQSQLSLMALIRYENEVMKLSEIMKPLQSSHTQTGEGEGTIGRKPLPASEKSDKTIQNQGG